MTILKNGLKAWARYQPLHVALNRHICGMLRAGSARCVGGCGAKTNAPPLEAALVSICAAKARTAAGRPRLRLTGSAGFVVGASNIGGRVAGGENGANGDSVLIDRLHLFAVAQPR